MEDIRHSDTSRDVENITDRFNILSTFVDLKMTFPEFCISFVSVPVYITIAVVHSLFWVRIPRRTEEWGHM